MGEGETAAFRDRSSLVRALMNTGITVVGCGEDLQIAWAENVPGAWSSEPVQGRRFHDFLPADVAESCDSAQRNVFSSGRPQTIEIMLNGPDSTSSFALWFDLIDDPQSPWMLVTAVDITEQKRREQTLRTLLREVAHRSKNMLAIIQSIASQTGRHSGTIETFLTRFRGRIESLASTQDLVTSSEWRGADLRDLVLGQAASYVADPSVSIRMEGVSPYFNPNAALHIGLAIHELAVNSVSYGALSKPNGYVTLSTTVQPDRQPPGLLLIWTEATTIADAQTGQKRFGSVALERVVPAAVNGRAALDLRPDSLVYRLEMPAENFQLSVQGQGGGNL